MLSVIVVLVAITIYCFNEVHLKKVSPIYWNMVADRFGLNIEIQSICISVFSSLLCSC